jgi:hypothetical protein
MLGTEATHAGRDGQTAELISSTRKAVVVGSTAMGVTSGNTGGWGGLACASATPGSKTASAANRPAIRTKRAGIFFSQDLPKTSIMAGLPISCRMLIDEAPPEP